MIHYMISVYYYLLFLIFNTNIEVSGQDFQPIWSSSIWQTLCLMELEIKPAFLVIPSLQNPSSDEGLSCSRAAAEDAQKKKASLTQTAELLCEAPIHERGQ